VNGFFTRGRWCGRETREGKTSARAASQVVRAHGGPHRTASADELSRATDAADNHGDIRAKRLGDTPPEPWRRRPLVSLLSDGC
jgi:hypothetical protein